MAPESPLSQFSLVSVDLNSVVCMSLVRIAGLPGLPLLPPTRRAGTAECPDLILARVPSQSCSANSRRLADERCVTPEKLTSWPVLVVRFVLIKHQ